MDKKQGKLIVIEGIDGSGKNTQVELLKKALASRGTPCEAISFPRYEDNIYGELVKRYLEGEFGLVAEVNPYFMALAYTGDRALAKTQIEKWLADGKVVLANRYVSSSKAHMGANLPEGEREEFFLWLDELEYKTNEIPKEDLTILLTVDPKIGQKNVQGIHGMDIHEESLKHLEEANKIYLLIAKKDINWYLVDCMKDNRMKNPEEIFSDILAFLQKELDVKV